MIVINMYGYNNNVGTAYLYSKLKMNGINAGIIMDDIAFSDFNLMPLDRKFMFHLNRFIRLEKEVDVVVTNCPLFLFSFYYLGEETMIEVAKKYSDINLFIRGGNYEIVEFLEGHDVDCLFYGDYEGEYNRMVDDIIHILKEGSVYA